ncbi:hypothetical protein A9Q84_09365 [Halobacteriovorax marinus]|uniref:FecR protein domain-containing protein n=1 Tax=Halobacteriovorax marinus TaxID=97084 RepID=A0A1Y5F6N0_9BACT|nr:hypothetical protein A9Q84_09365 [Halobacteriovorax marinus]
MKKSYSATRKINIFFLIATLLVSFTSFADSPELMVRAVKGNAFLVSKGKTVTLKPGDHIYDFQEVFTEVGGQISVANFNDQVFHLAGGGNIRVLKGLIELQNGYLWLESIAKTDSEYQIQTPNSRILFTEGEAIIDFDNSSGKSQVLVLQGRIEFGNLFQDFLRTEVSAGKFSFISKDYESGAPRNPTPVGRNTFSKVQALFDKPKIEKKRSISIKQVDSILAQEDTASKVHATAKSRGIASVSSAAAMEPIDEPVMTTESKSTTNESGIIYIRPKVRNHSKDTMLLNYHSKNITKFKLKKVKKKFKPSYEKKSGVKIYVFGRKGMKSNNAVASKSKLKSRGTRAPASVGTAPAVKLKKDVFESSLIKEYKKQLRHSKEVNSLIQELKSYDQDYKQAY